MPVRQLYPLASWVVGGQATHVSWGIPIGICGCILAATVLPAPGIQMRACTHTDATVLKQVCTCKQTHATSKSGLQLPPDIHHLMAKASRIHHCCYCVSTAVSSIDGAQGLRPSVSVPCTCESRFHNTFSCMYGYAGYNNVSAWRAIPTAPELLAMLLNKARDLWLSGDLRTASSVARFIYDASTSCTAANTAACSQVGQQVRAHLRDHTHPYRRDLLHTWLG